MKKNSPLFLTLSLSLALGLSGCHNPADDVAEAKTSDAKQETTSPSTPSANVVTYEFTSDSTIDFVGSKVTGSHGGGFKTFTGSFSVKGGELQAGQAISIDMNSLWADSDRLAGHLKNEDFFDVEKFPTSTFTPTAIAKADQGFNVTGNLTMHGVTKSISFPADIQVTPEMVQVKAEFFIKRFDFEIKYPGRKDDLIRDEVVIKLNIKAKPASA